tara:strand:+ start:66156 stop:66809 length:654 start_codon:yes stop_codon:yes gene_type:complete
MNPEPSKESPMSNTVELYYNPMSRATITHWMLEEAEADFVLKMIDFTKDENNTEAFLKLNPMGKLPTIVHRGAVVTEAAAICAYIADQFPKNELAPALNSPERGAYYRWLFFGAGCVEPATLDKALDRGNPDKASSVGYGSYERTFDTLELVLRERSFLVGEQFTAADVYMASQLDLGMIFKTIDTRPVFSQYVARCQDRPGYKRCAATHSRLMAKA